MGNKINLDKGFGKNPRAFDRRREAARLVQAIGHEAIKNNRPDLWEDHYEYCEMCRRKVWLTKSEDDMYHAEVRRRMDGSDKIHGGEFDGLVFGEKINIALPHLPCDHYRVITRKLEKVDGGRWEYRWEW